MAWTVKFLIDNLAGMTLPMYRACLLATRPQLIVSLSYLQFMYDMSDYAVVEPKMEFLDWQHLTSEKYLHHYFSLHLTSLVKWVRKRGEGAFDWLINQTSRMGQKLGVFKTCNPDQVVVYTSYTEKAIAHPMDGKLVEQHVRALG